MLSRNEDYVDKKGDPKALFWKLDYMIKKDPEWLQPKINRTKLHIENMDNGSTIEGESTTQRAGRGGRFTLIL
ncbi:terminase, partial [Acinetobacter baumannii]